MSIVGCPECGEEVSESAQSCQKCGYGVKEHFAKIRRKDSVDRNTERASRVLVASIYITMICIILAPPLFYLQKELERRERQRSDLRQQNREYSSSLRGLHQLHVRHPNISLNEDERQTSSDLSSKWKATWEEYRNTDSYDVETLEHGLSLGEEEHAEWIDFYNTVRARAKEVKKRVDERAREAIEKELSQLSTLEPLRKDYGSISTFSVSLRCPDCNKSVRDGSFGLPTIKTWRCDKSGKTYKSPYAENVVKRRSGPMTISGRFPKSLEPLSESDTFEHYVERESPSRRPSIHRF